MRKPEHLTRRERQVMDLLFEMGEATVNEVRDRLPDEPTYSAIRAVLARPVAKGELNFAERGPRDVYSPATNVDSARVSALRKVINTFFGSSSLKTMTALLDETSRQLSAEELQMLEKQLADARRRKRK